MILRLVELLRLKHRACRGYRQRPGNKGRLRYPTQAPAGSRYFSHEVVPVQGGYGVVFASHGTKVFEHYACRGTNEISGR